MAKNPIPNIILKRGKTKPIWQGHPWIFPKAIASGHQAIEAGALVQVEDDNHRLIGCGVFNPYSLYRVRMLAYANEGLDLTDLNEIVRRRFERAKALRQSLGLPNKHTNAYRFFNSEGDFLSGLTVDLYDDVAVVSSSAYWVELHRSTIQSLLKEILAPSHIIWLSQGKSLVQDGCKTPEKETPSGIKRIVTLSGVQYNMDFDAIQKTGLFLDQRENHQALAAYCANKKVLDLYTYAGGFGLSAAKAGAVEVTAIDSSAKAIDLAKKNAQLNNLKNIQFICDDVANHFSLASEHEVIILDPPKLVPSRQHLARAIQHYQHLHINLLEKMQANSLLLTCNCSSAMTWDLFLTMLRESAVKASRHIQVLRKMTAAADHPILPAFPEGEYLRAVLINVL